MNVRWYLRQTGLALQVLRLLVQLAAILARSHPIKLVRVDIGFCGCLCIVRERTLQVPGASGFRGRNARPGRISSLGARVPWHKHFLVLLVT